MSNAGTGNMGAFCKDCPAGGPGGPGKGCAQLKYRPEMVPPDQWIEGDPKSPVWIIGLNPKTTKNADQDMNLSIDQLRDEFSSRSNRVPYFKDFGKVSSKLLAALGRKEGVAHTDIVKCDSAEWPPKGISSSEIELIEKACAKYLEGQIRAHKPKLLICNGSSVSTYVKALLGHQEKSSNDLDTCFECHVDGEPLHIILSGFIGRIDNYSRRRLGRDIEQRIEALGIKLSQLGHG